jgi:dihydrodipicolinate synthase/N-acetylneuraminate lyase
MENRIPKGLSGVFAALPTPFGADGAPNWAALEALVEFGLDRGLKGLCLGGATGEYPATSVENRREIYRRVAHQAKGRAEIICATGSEHVGQVKQLAREAVECGAIAILLPPPIFLPYPQQELVEFVGQVGADLPLPVLIYNIPQCTRDLGIDNVLHLINTVPNIIGLKDSSGSKANLQRIQAARAQGPIAFLIGSDDLLYEAFQNGALGSISGIASACPELVLPLYEASHACKMEQARALQARLDEFIFRIHELPSPWAIKLALQVRGLDMGTLAWPMGPELRRKAQDFQTWFADQIRTYESVPSAPAKA